MQSVKVGKAWQWEQLVALVAKEGEFSLKRVHQEPKPGNVPHSVSCSSGWLLTHNVAGAGLEFLDAGITGCTMTLGLAFSFVVSLGLSP